MISVFTRDGTKLDLFVPKKKPPVPAMDLVKNYGHRVLELGMLYKSLLDMCKLPDRDRGLMLLKLAMLHFKAHKNKSKYAYENHAFISTSVCSFVRKKGQ